MHHRRPLSLFLSLTLAVFLLAQSTYAAVLAIDYGAEWIKASVIKPGVPFDVLLNKDSKRKIRSSVAWKGNDRLFGSDAFNLMTRYPTDSFSYLKMLEGAPFESEPVALYRSISPAELVRTARDTVAVQRLDTNRTEWSVEELIAMQFSYVKELAESVGASETREPMQDVVVAVPPYFTQFERDAVTDAVEIAGLRLLALVNDGTAVALNYAMSRSFSQDKEWHVIYDAGASAVRATVVSFSTVPGNGKTTGKDSTHIVVAGIGYDRSAGGMEVDRRLRDMLAADFEAKHKRSIKGDAKGMAKLLKEAGRVKAILSANMEARVAVESIAFDQDYRSVITRQSLEDACADMKHKFSQPIRDAIANANLTPGDIRSIILTGGHSRMPIVQTAVKEVICNGTIATSVNADEAAVLGAALYGASVSRQYRTKDIKVVDIAPYDIQVSYQSEIKTTDSDNAQSPLAAPKTINTLVFQKGSKAGSKKTLTFKRKDDFALRMAYKGDAGADLPRELLEAEISGVKEAFAELVEAGATEPAIKITVTFSESGFAGVMDAAAHGEIKHSFTDKIKGFLAGSKDDATPLSSETTSSISKSPATGSSFEEASSVTSPAPSPTVEMIKRDTIPLQLYIKPLSVPAMTPLDIRRSRDRLIAVDMAETDKRRREEVRNGLEAYLYRLRDLLSDNDEASPFKKCSKASEREAIEKKAYETLHWMNEEAEDAQFFDFEEKRDVVEQLERPIQFRYKEIESFTSVLNESQRINWSTRIFITEARKNLTAERVSGNILAKYTEEEIDTLEKTLKDHEVWLNERVEKQKAVKMNEDPVLTTADMKTRAKTLENALLKLARRKSPPKAKKASSTSKAKSTSTGAFLTSNKSEGVPIEDAYIETSSTTNRATSTATDRHVIRDEL